MSVLGAAQVRQPRNDGVCVAPTAISDGAAVRHERILGPSVGQRAGAAVGGAGATGLAAIAFAVAADDARAAVGGAGATGLAAVAFAVAADDARAAVGGAGATGLAAGTFAIAADLASTAILGAAAAGLAAVAFIVATPGADPGQADGVGDDVLLGRHAAAVVIVDGEPLGTAGLESVRAQAAPGAADALVHDQGLLAGPVAHHIAGLLVFGPLRFGPIFHKIIPPLGELEAPPGPVARHAARGGVGPAQAAAVAALFAAPVLHGAVGHEAGPGVIDNAAGRADDAAGLAAHAVSRAGGSVGHQHAPMVRHRPRAAAVVVALVIVEIALAGLPHLRAAAAVEVEGFPSPQLLHDLGELGAVHAFGFVGPAIDHHEDEGLLVLAQAHGRARVAGLEVAPIGKTAGGGGAAAGDLFALHHQLGKAADQAKQARRQGLHHLGGGPALGQAQLGGVLLAVFAMAEPHVIMLETDPAMAVVEPLPGIAGPSAILLFGPGRAQADCLTIDAHRSGLVEVAIDRQQRAGLGRPAARAGQSGGRLGRLHMHVGHAEVDVRGPEVRRG